jgi:hypothetical protein
MRDRPKPARTGILLLLAALPLLADHARAARWGRDGHLLSGLAAATNLPAQMPAFFRTARTRLSYLNFEPDRWRDPQLAEMNEAFQYDHFIDLENVPTDALEASDRFVYLLMLSRAGLRDPQREGGLLPFRIIEMYDRLLVEFRLWRQEQNPQTRRWIEERIINDAGILGHYVADGANPHHTTIHFNGWAEGKLNPNGYTLDRTFHRRFEADFVGAKVRIEDLVPRLTAPRTIANVRAEVMAHIRKSNSLVDRLYALEKTAPFGQDTNSAQHKAFAVERLSAGIELLRSLWWTAWLRSGDPVNPRQE